jgi:dihydroorotate dehydrogenase electron transfer subunit
LNIRAFDGAWGPLLRRPFSVSSIDNNTLSILFNVVGTGPRILSSRRVGDTLDVLGPLGKPFGVPGDYDEAILVGGGVGVAPFPLLTKELLRAGKPVTTLLGARNKEMIFLEGLQNVQLATDDGSVGMRGNVVELLERFFQTNRTIRPKIFGCGPTPMLRALSEFAKRMNLYCELSLEGDMACGVGICQGCPVERTNGEKQYALTCVEGPTFDCREVRL